MDNILINILSILQNSSFEEQFIMTILKRLKSLSYTANGEDAWMISFAILKVENIIKNSCNISSIPEGLYAIAIDMICGEFLYSKKQTGSLEGFDLETAVKQVQTGDTNVTFAIENGASVEQRLDALFSYLIGSGKGEFVCYRKIRW